MWETIQSRFAHAVTKDAVFEIHKLLCTKSQLKLGFNYKKLLFCAVGGLILYFLRKYKERVC